MSETDKKDSCKSLLRVAHPAKLLVFLTESFPDRSRKSVKSLLEQKQIMIGNRVVTQFDYPLEPGMDVMVLKKKSDSQYYAPENEHPL